MSCKIDGEQCLAARRAATTIHQLFYSWIHSAGSEPQTRTSRTAIQCGRQRLREIAIMWTENEACRANNATAGRCRYHRDRSFDLDVNAFRRRIHVNWLHPLHHDDRPQSLRGFMIGRSRSVRPRHIPLMTPVYDTIRIRYADMA